MVGAARWEGCRFNSRAHGGRDDRRVTVADFCTVFQFTRPRGARPNDRFMHFFHRGVSIHAPTGGATIRAARRTVDAIVSIHAPTGGRDSSPETPNAKINGFNSRAHGGRDHDVNANRAR